MDDSTINTGVHCWVSILFPILLLFQHPRQMNRKNLSNPTFNLLIRFFLRFHLLPITWSPIIVTSLSIVYVSFFIWPASSLHSSTLPHCLKQNMDNDRITGRQQLKKDEVQLLHSKGLGGMTIGKLIENEPLVQLAKQTTQLYQLGHRYVLRTCNRKLNYYSQN